MVWGAFCGTVKSDLVIIPGKATLDSALYVQNVMEPHLIPFWHQCCEVYGWVAVMEDGAPGHKGFAKNYRQLNEMEHLPWPTQSPDLNLRGTLAGYGDETTGILGLNWGHSGIDSCVKHGTARYTLGPAGEVDS